MEEQIIDPNIAYDVVTLPTGGIFYPNKKKYLKVAYLTAADENILTSPNLINTDRMISELLKRKIQDKDILIEELYEADKQAILIFLRNTAFGTEYKVKLKDPKTDKSFEYEFNLDSVTCKDFTLTPNSNGTFNYRMNKSGVDVTFKFLTPTEEEFIQKTRDNWDIKNGPVPYVTLQLETMIHSIQGNEDPMNKRNFIQNLPIKDSQDFRRFVNKNKPGLILTQETITPSGEKIEFELDFGVEFFRPWYGLR